MTLKTAVFLYEPFHAEWFLALPTPGAEEIRTVIAVGADVEFALEKKGVRFNSARGMRSMPVRERLIFAGDLGKSLLKHPLLATFAYRDINIGRLYLPALQFYLARFLYNLDIILSALATEAYDKVLVPPPGKGMSATGIVLESFVANRFLDAARLAAEESGISFESPYVETTVARNSMFTIKRRLFSAVMHVLNRTVVLLVPRKKIRILASEHWKNIAPVMREMPDAELVLLDRVESRAAGIRAILRNRMRFVHIEGYLSTRGKRQAKERAASYADTYERVKNELFKGAIFRGCSLAPHLERVMRHVVTGGGEEAVQAIEGVRGMYERLSPDVVIVRAGTSAQIHFAVLCEVARAAGIPSLEIQHGLLYFGPESYLTDRYAEYVAEYGPTVREDFKLAGYGATQLFDIGSPRFDAYKEEERQHRMELNRDAFTLACIAPDIMPGYLTDAYDVLDYFTRIGEAVAQIPHARVSIKLRANHQRRAFFIAVLERTFVSIPHEVVESESVVSLLARVDAVITSFSTMLIEAFLSERPVVYVPSSDMHVALAESFAKSGANGTFLIADAPREIFEACDSLREPRVRDVLIDAASRYMKHSYAFDGQSSVRLASALRTLARGSA